MTLDNFSIKHASLKANKNDEHNKSLVKIQPKKVKQIKKN